MVSLRIIRKYGAYKLQTARALLDIPFPLMVVGGMPLTMRSDMTVPSKGASNSC